MALGSASGHEDNGFQALAAAVDEGREAESGWGPHANSQTRSREEEACERRRRGTLSLERGGVEFVHILKFSFVSSRSLWLMDTYEVK